MLITGGIIQIIVLLLPVILAAIAAKNTPAALQNTSNEEIDKAVAVADVGIINVLLHDKLQDKTGGDPGRPGSSI